mgnify:FL=1|jgi:hypothetical protein
MKMKRKKMYWNYESLYFVCNKNPNEKEFKEYIIQIIDKLSEYFLSFEKALKDYFDNTK